MHSPMISTPTPHFGAQVQVTATRQKIDELRDYLSKQGKPLKLGPVYVREMDYASEKAAVNQRFAMERQTETSGLISASNTAMSAKIYTGTVSVGLGRLAATFDYPFHLLRQWIGNAFAPGHKAQGMAISDLFAHGLAHTAGQLIGIGVCSALAWLPDMSVVPTQLHLTQKGLTGPVDSKNILPESFDQIDFKNAKLIPTAENNPEKAPQA